jgi:hypothetical protein
MGLPEVDFRDPNWRQAAYIKGQTHADLGLPPTGVTKQYQNGYDSVRPLPPPKLEPPKIIQPRDSYKRW